MEELKSLDKSNKSPLHSQISNSPQKVLQLFEEKLFEAHKEFINSVVDVNDDFYASASSDFKVHLWSK